MFPLFKLVTNIISNLRGYIIKSIKKLNIPGIKKMYILIFKHCQKVFAKIVGPGHACRLNRSL